MFPWQRWMVLFVAATMLAGCSLEKLAVNRLGDALAGSGDVFSSDEDPELVRDALPFALKTMETLIAQSPEHEGLRLAACKGFTQYAYAFVELPAERLEASDYRAAERQRDRALKLYLRARDGCLAALDLRRPGTSRAVVADPEVAVGAFTAADIELLYWTAASWGAAISLALDQPDLVVDLPSARALLERALALDPDWDDGTLHEAMIAVEGLPETMGGSIDRARRHFDRALELSNGERPGTYLAWASKISVQQQDRAEFERLLREALEIDPESRPGERLVTIIQQRRARFLLASVDDLFI